MFRGKHGLAALLALLCVIASSLALVSPSAIAKPKGDAADKRLWKAQQAFLDPQTEPGRVASDEEVKAARRADRLRSEGTTAASTMAAAPKLLSGVEGGRWAYVPQLPSGFNPVHMVVGRAKVLVVAGSGNDLEKFAEGTFSSYVCNSTLGSCRKVDTPVDLFCAGHVLLPDGRALVGGGTLALKPNKGAKYLYAFDFVSERYERLSPMEVGRWYPTMVTTADGETLITGGLDEFGAFTGTSEVFDHRTNTHHMLAHEKTFPLYPRITLTKRPELFYSGVAYGSYSPMVPPGFWDPFKGTFKPVSGLRTPAQRSSGASCFVGDLRSQNLLVMGGGAPAVSTTDKIKLSDSSPKFTPGPTLKAKKQYLSCLSLPDGSLMEIGGGSANKIASASYEVSLLSSISSSWKTMNPIPTGNHRLYHSSHFLRDDGRVVSLGSNPEGEPTSETIMVYSPPYIYKGTRPTITSAPSAIKRYGTFSIKTTGGATRVTFTKPPSPTHGLDSGDGYMSFPIKDGKVDMSGAWKRYMPPGYYRMWAVNAKGAVSTAKWVYYCDSPGTEDSCHCGC
jgi:hypothetical protein